MSCYFSVNSTQRQFGLTGTTPTPARQAMFTCTHKTHSRDELLPKSAIQCAFGQ